MLSKKELDTKPSLDTIETDTSILDPEYYRSTIHSIIADIRQKYNGVQLKTLLLNIQKLEQYNMIKLARCNKQLEKQATFSFKLFQIEVILEKYNSSFIRVLQDSPDYRLDQLYRRFVHINHKIAELDPDHMKIFGGNIKYNTGQPGRIITKSNRLFKEQMNKNNQDIHNLNLKIQLLSEQNVNLRSQIQIARSDTEAIINQVMKFKQTQKQYRNQINQLNTSVYQLRRILGQKDQTIRQKDELAQNYKVSIQKLKISLLTPTKLTKTNLEKDKYKNTDYGFAQKIQNTVETAIKRVLQSNSARQPLIYTSSQQQKDRQSPGFKSQKGNKISHLNKTPPKSSSIVRFKNGEKQNNDNDIWNMLLTQCSCLQQLLLQ